MKSLLNKNILFISPEFFSIDRGIINELKKRGANVQWYDERSVKSSLGRAVNAFNPAIFRFRSRRYYKRMLDDIEQDIDIILVIKGEMISKNTMKSFREKWPDVEIILYLYDSVKNVKGILNRIELYDKVISFDPKDCKQYGFEFRPLFCDFNIDHNEHTVREKKDWKYDLCFYGTMYGDRFDIISYAKDFCNKNGIKFYCFCFLRGKFIAIYYFITKKGFRKLGIKEIAFKPKKGEELKNILMKSNVVLDANDEQQVGLTIRTIETLMAGKKMITTNLDIVNYDFYNKNNIFVLDRNHPSIPKDFFTNDFEPISKSILYRYTVEGWVDDVFK